MKIAIYHNLPSGGAKRHTLEQVRELTRRGHELVEVAPNTADLAYCSFAPYVARRVVWDFQPARQLQRRLPFVGPYVHAIQGLATLRRLDRLNGAIARAIDAEGFDVVVAKDCHLAMNPPILRYLETPSLFQCHHGLRHRLADPTARQDGSATLAARLKGAYYAPATRLYQREFQACERASARAATRVLTNSRFSRQLIADYYGVDAGVIYPGINTATFRPLPEERENYVLSVGALIYGKGYRFLVAALGRIDPARRPTLFVAANSVDPAEERTVRELAAAAGVCLHLERIADDERLVRVYNQARAFVYAPIQEALGMAPLEAMACGTPVVAIAEGGVRETILDGETGVLVDRDEQTFADALDRLLADAPTRERLAAAGIANVREHWTWSRAVDRLEDELRNLAPTLDRRWNHTLA